MGFAVKRVLRRVLRSGSEKGVSRGCLERPLGEYAPLSVRPIVCGCLSCPCGFRDSCCSCESHWVAKHRFGKRWV